MTIVIFGTSGPTEQELCREALAAGCRVTAAVRRREDYPLERDALTVVHADVIVGGCDDIDWTTTR